MELREYIKRYPLVTDGAMGTYYARVKNKESALAEYACLYEPKVIEDIHIAYMRAGARLIRTNTFATNTVTLPITPQEQNQYIQMACTIAKNAVKQFYHEKKETVYIAGSIGPILEHAECKEEEIREQYQRMIDAMLQEQVDAILFETFADDTYICELASYIRQKSDVVIIANFSVNKSGYTQAGISVKRLFQELEQIEALDVCGLNCEIGSGHMLSILKNVPLPKQKWIAAIPNAGYPEQLHNRMVFRDNVSYFQENMKKVYELGIDIIGGCCGTTPEYIQRLQEIVHGREKIARKVQNSPKNAYSIVVKKNEFMELFEKKKKVVAVELDPPYDADCDKVLACAHALKKANVDMVTIADSPMGRSRIDSIMMGIKIMQEINLPVMPHVCCRDKNMIAMRSTLLGAYVHGIRNCLIVTGDPVPSKSRVRTTGVFDYNSIQLMNFIKEMNEEHLNQEPFLYGGALNYGRGFLPKVVERMEKKIQAGASYFLTQPIFSNEDVARIREIKKQVDTKILCGIMPFVSYRNANFVKNEITGIQVPEKVVEKYHPDMSKEEAEWVGANVANEIIESLSDVADGYYFMLPFNRVSLMNKITIR